MKRLSMLTLLLAAACAETATSPTTTHPTLARQPAPPPPNVYLEWDDSFTAVIGPDTVPAGIRGDGRLADGSASGGNSAYQGGMCGVVAYQLSNETRWDLYTATGCGSARVLRFWLAGATGLSTDHQTKSIARDLLSLAVGESRTDQFEGFNLDQPNCTRAEFNSAYAGSNNPRRTRLPDAADGAKQWRIESQGSHQAMCLYTAKGKDQLGGLTVAMPWAYTIREVK